LLWTFWTFWTLQRLQPADGRISCDSLGSTRCLIDQMKGFLESASQTAKKRDLWSAVFKEKKTSGPSFQCCTSISLKSSLRRNENQVSTLPCSKSYSLLITL
jgi:hypothetical protein